MRIRFSTLIALVLLAVTQVAAAEESEARKIVNRAKAEAGSIEGQAEALARLAWPAGPYQPDVAALAREELVLFGEHGLAALRAAVERVDPLYSADVTAALIDARRLVRSGIPPDYLPALEEVVWSGSPDARRLAIPELAKVQYTLATLACIDSAIDDPSLRGLVVRSLARFKDEGARFYLEEILLHGPDDLRETAARSLAQIGGEAKQPLHTAVLSPDPVVRLPAIRGMIPFLRMDDLNVLYEYVAQFPDDDEEILAEVRAKAQVLEQIFEQELDRESASPPPGN
jgi:HEAT repeat protein